MLIHGFIGASRVNGPGVRAVVFFQGCKIGCQNCWNKDSHGFTSGQQSSTLQVAERIVGANCVAHLEGVTFSGGEPMHQAPEVMELIRTVRRDLPGLSFGMYSGYSWRELESGRYWTMSEFSADRNQRLWADLKRALDFAVLGRYVASRPTAIPLRTSANQELVLFSSRYSAHDFQPLEVEVNIEPDGLIQLTGFPIFGSPL
jgi:anaerobic ribonucleoside-triphosphate reductase activating protein